MSKRTGYERMSESDMAYDYDNGDDEVRERIIEERRRRRETAEIKAELHAGARE